MIKRLCAEINFSFSEKFDVENVISVDVDPQAGHSLLLNFNNFKNIIDDPNINNCIALAKWLMKNSLVAFAPGIAHGFDGLKLRISYASLGHAYTYNSCINSELKSVISEFTHIFQQHGLTFKHIDNNQPSLINDELMWLGGREILVDVFQNRIAGCLNMLKASCAKSLA